VQRGETGSLVERTDYFVICDYWLADAFATVHDSMRDRVEAKCAIAFAQPRDRMQGSLRVICDSGRRIELPACRGAHFGMSVRTDFLEHAARNSLAQLSVRDQFE
jgi:hypothetical protein